MAQNGRIVEEKFIVEFRKELYDITEFMRKHPGGVNTLNGYNRKNIESRFKSVDHSSAAEYLLKDYKLKRTNGDLNNNNEFDESMEVRTCHHLIDCLQLSLIKLSKRST